MNNQTQQVNLDQAREEYYEPEYDYQPLEWDQSIAKCEECNKPMLQAGTQDGPDDYRFIYKCNNENCKLYEEVIDP